jgi:aminocarboxymuconate-semialdehyde decarboxylase
LIIDGQHHYYIEGFPIIEIKEHLRVMDQFGIDVAVLTNPLRTTGGNLSTFRTTNDQLANVVKENPERFVFCPSIPIYDGKEALDELERARSKYEVRGVFIQPVNWRMDSPKLWPLYENLAESNTPVFMHPVYSDLPVEQIYGTHSIGAAIGFTFNTSITITSLIFSGLLETYPELKIVLPHLGGSLPFVIGRLDAAYVPSEFKIPKPPSEYLKMIYVDTVSYEKEPIEMTLKVMGPKKLVFGTDFSCPGKGFVRPREFLNFIRELDLSEEEKKDILGNNLAKLLRLEVLAKH